MRPSRRFHPAALALEGRVVLSHISPTATVPGAPAPGAAVARFATDINNTISAGLPVYEQLTTRYSNDPSVQTVDELIVPNNANGTTTTDEWINLKDNGGVEKVVIVKTVTGATTTQNITTTLPNGTIKKEVEVAVNSNGSTTHTNTTTLPGGAVQVNTYTDVSLLPHETRIIDGFQPSPQGGTETYTGVTVKTGNRTVTHHTYGLPDGTIETTRSVLFTHDDSGNFETYTTHIPGFSPSSYSTRTTITRLTPPTAS